MLSSNAWILLFIFFLDGKPNVVHDYFEEQCQCETVLKLLRQVHEEGVGYCKPGNIKYSLNGKPITLTRFNLEDWPRSNPNIHIH